MSGKTISRIFKFAVPAGIVICAILKWTGIFSGATIPEICAVWTTVYTLGAGTIDAGIIVDKYTEGKDGRRKSSQPANGD